MITVFAAFDYDKTWTRDPEAFRAIVLLLQQRGHVCILVTGRSNEGSFGAEVRRAIGTLMPIVFAAGGWKREAAERAGYKVETWWDDQPEGIASAPVILGQGKDRFTAEWTESSARDPAQNHVVPPGPGIVKAPRRAREEHPLVAAAREFARERHAGQFYGPHAYTLHLAEVVAVLRRSGLRHFELLAAAWLHDTVEDTATTRAEIDARFGERVAELVWAVTGQGTNRAERVASIYAKLRALGSDDAASLKIADRIANVEASRAGGARTADLLRMYREEAPGFEAALHPLGNQRLWSRLRKALREGT